MKHLQKSYRGSGLLLFIGVFFILISVWRAIQCLVVSVVFPQSFSNVSQKTYEQLNYANTSFDGFGLKYVFILYILFLVFCSVWDLLYGILTIVHRRNGKSATKICIMAILHILLSASIFLIGRNWAAIIPLLCGFFMLLGGILLFFPKALSRNPEKRKRQEIQHIHQFGDNIFEPGIKRPRSD